MCPRFENRSSKSSRRDRPLPRRGRSNDSSSRRSEDNGGIERIDRRGGPKNKREDWGIERSSDRNSSRARFSRDRRNKSRKDDFDSRNESFSSRFPSRNQRGISSGNSQRKSLYFQTKKNSFRERENLEDINVDSPKDSYESFGPQPAEDLLWGRHATQTALETGRPIHRIWCTPEVRSAHKFLQLLREAKSSGILVEEVTWARLGQLTGGAVHQGIVMQTAAAETLDLPSLIKGCDQLGESPLLLALDGLTDPQNLGAIVRSAEAMGAHGLVLPQRRSAGLTGSVAKVAAGALEHLPVARVVNLNRSLQLLKDSGYRVVGLAEEGDVTLSEVDLEGPLVLVAGSEGKGLSLLTRRHCDQLVRIPLRGITPSLNASVATAICLYEIARRGWMSGICGQAPSPKLKRPKCFSDE